MLGNSVGCQLTYRMPGSSLGASENLGGLAQAQSAQTSQGLYKHTKAHLWGHLYFGAPASINAAFSLVTKFQGRDEALSQSTHTHTHTHTHHSTKPVRSYLPYRWERERMKEGFTLQIQQLHIKH